MTPPMETAPMAFPPPSYSQQVLPSQILSSPPLLFLRRAARVFEARLFQTLQHPPFLTLGSTRPEP